MSDDLTFFITRQQSVTVRSGFTQAQLVEMGVPESLFTDPTMTGAGPSVTKRLEAYLCQEDLPDLDERFEIDGDVEGFEFEISAPGRTYDHEARPDDSAEEGEHCRECGEGLTWVGPGMYDYLHIDDKENQ